MRYAAGIDIGSTYTKAVLVDGDRQIRGRSMVRTGFRLVEAGEKVLAEACELAGASRDAVAYTIATGFGRHQAAFTDAQVTDLTAAARAARALFPRTSTVLDIGGQTMKACRLDAQGKVVSFRLNDKCAAGTGAFLEKTARYMGFGTEEIGALAATSRSPVTISGVCAVFAESEVINHLSQGTAPADIMHGSMVSLVERSVQLLKRVQMQPEFTVIGGILRYATMVREIQARLGGSINVAHGDLPQYMNAFGAAILAAKRMALAGAPA